MRLSKVADALSIAYAAGLTVELRSTPGAGKSSKVEQWAADMSIKLDQPFALLTFMLATISPYDFGGFMYPAEDPYDETGRGMRVSAFSRPPVMPHPSQFREMKGGSYRVYVNGEAVESFDGVPEVGALFLDEYGQADIDMKKMSADLMLNRRIRGVALPKGYSVIAASNRQEDRSGVTKDLSFVNNRLLRIDVTNDIEDFKRFAMSVGAHYLVTAWASFAPSKVFSTKPPEQGMQFCTPRSLMAVSRLIQTYEKYIGPVDWESDFIREMIIGAIGEGAGTEFVAYARMASQLTTWEEIIKDPEKAPIPDHKKVDALHAICDMIASRVDAKSVVAAFTYLLRAPREFQVATLTTVAQRVPQIVKIPEMNKWLQKNQHLLVVATVK